MDCAITYWSSLFWGYWRSHGLADAPGQVAWNTSSITSFSLEGGQSKIGSDTAFHGLLQLWGSSHAMCLLTWTSSLKDNNCRSVEIGKEERGRDIDGVFEFLSLNRLNSSVYYVCCALLPIKMLVVIGFLKIWAPNLFLNSWSINKTFIENTTTTVNCKELAHVIMEAEKFQDLQSTNWRPRVPIMQFPSKSEVLRTRETMVCFPVQKLKCSRLQKRCCFSSSPKGRQRLISQLKAVRLVELSLIWGKVRLLVLVMSSTDVT